MNPCTVLITGATGGIGTVVAQGLVDHSAHVLGLDKDHPEVEVEPMLADLRGEASVAASLFPGSLLTWTVGA